MQKENRQDVILLKGVSKSYGEVAVFKEQDFVFEKSCIHIIMGESGSGKTTLLRILMGLETVDCGEVFGLKDCKCASVFQEDRLCENLSVSLNIRLPHGKLSHVEKDQLQKQIRENLKAVGLEGVSKKTVRTLSGGMKRRVAILRAAMAESDLLFFDEPLKGLDGENKLRLMQFLIPYLEGKTVFWVTHDQTEVHFFKEVQLWKL